MKDLTRNFEGLPWDQKTEIKCLHASDSPPNGTFSKVPESPSYRTGSVSGESRCSPAPLTLQEGDNDYTTLQTVWHQFALEDCIPDDDDRKCHKRAYGNFARGAGIDDVATNLSECLLGNGVNKDQTEQSVQCFSSEAYDPAVEARAKEYLGY